MTARSWGGMLLLSVAAIAGCADRPAATDAQPSVDQAQAQPAPAASAHDTDSGQPLSSRPSDQTPPETPATAAAPEAAATAEPASSTDTSAAQAGPAAEAAADSRGESPPESWRNFRNGTDLRGIAGTTLPDNLQLLWEFTTHDGITSTAAIDGGRVFVAELSGFVRCLDLKSGQEFWQYRTIESTDPEEFAPGFNAPVTVSDTAVFVGDEEGTLHALDRESGRKLWTFPTEGEIKGGATVLEPAAAGEAPRVMFGSHDGHLYCLNAATGEQIWAFDTLGPVNGSQAIADGPSDGEDAADAEQVTFVTGCDKPFLRVVNLATGEQVAEIPLDESLLIASPALIGDVLYFGTSDGAVIALNWRQQTREWTYSDPSRSQEIHSSPAATEELILIGSRDKRLYAINRHTGEVAWKFETRGPIDSSPVVVGDRVFFGSADRNLYGVDLNGNEVFKYNTGRRISASPAVGEGHLVIGCEGSEGKLFCFGAGKEG